jgi:predicted NAD/FAD-binding protein
VAYSFWLAEPAPTLHSRPQSERPDVEIVGGGITGISAALTLPHRVRDVSFYGLAPAGRRPG